MQLKKVLIITRLSCILVKSCYNWGEFSIKYFIRSDLLFSQRFKEIRLSKGLTQEQIGKLVGKAESTIARYESGSIKNIPLDLIINFAKILDVTPYYLMGWSHKIERYASYENMMEDYLNNPDDFDNENDWESSINEEYEDYSEFIEVERKPDFVYLQTDYSMEPFILQGAKVTVNPNLSADNGNFVCARYEDEDKIVVRRFFQERGYTVLIPSDLSYGVMVGDSSKPIEVLGVVMKVSQEI